METDETMYHATPQTKGKLAHEGIDQKKASNRADDILALSVYSETYGIMLYTEILTSCISNPANLSLYILCFAALKSLFYKHIRHRYILCYKLTP